MADLHPRTDPDHDGVDPAVGVGRVVSRRRALAIGGGLAACAVAGGWGRATAPGPGSALDKLLDREVRTTNNARRLAADPDAVFGVRTEERVVALTFDDGPDGRHTADVHDLLHARRLHATFFAIGRNAVAHPELLLAARAAGHSIGNHTRAHRPLDRLSADDAFAEIIGGTDDLGAAGIDPDLFRPPYGYTDDVIGAFVAGAGLRSVYWSSCIEHEMSGRSPAEGARRLVADVRPGDIVLAHDGSGMVHRPEHRRFARDATLAALPHLLDGLAARGFRVVDLPRLLEVGPPRAGGDPDL